jgi:hypothetical protein
MIGNDPTAKRKAPVYQKNTGAFYIRNHDFFSESVPAK